MPANVCPLPVIPKMLMEDPISPETFLNTLGRFLESFWSLDVTKRHQDHRRICQN